MKTEQTKAMRRFSDRRAGSLLLEVVVAMSLLLVGLLGLMTTFAGNFKATQDVVERDEVRVAMENLTEVLRQSNFSELYNTFNGSTLEVPSLKGPGGGNATVTVTCHVNELALPQEFGPVLDIDGSGGLDNPDCRASYRLLPIQLRLNYMARHGAEMRDLYLILRE